VYADEDSDASVVFEIVEYSADVEDCDAVNYFLSDLGACNDALRSEVIRTATLPDADVPNIPVRLAKFYGEGVQIVKCKRSDGEEVDAPNEEVSEEVNVYMFVLRLPDHNADVLISANAPRVAEAFSPAHFEEVFKSFAIEDWSLFA